MDAFPSVSLSNKEVLAQIEATKANIRRLTSQIHDLERSRQNERQTLARLCFLIIPVGKLPTELLIEIFTLAVHSDPISMPVVDRRSRPFGPDHPTHQTLLLSHVCSFWREIVIGSPRLWAVGLVDVRLDGKNCPKDYLDLLHTLLDRSAPLPISISLTHNAEFPSPRAPSPATIVEVIAPTAFRWKCLKVDKSSFEALKESFPGPLTVLKDLNLRFNVDLHGAPIDLFLGCSHLRRLSLSRNFLWRHDSLLRMPWHQLTDLQLVEFDPAICHSILLQCKNLMWARITTSHWDVDAPGPFTALPSNVDAPTITLPFLKLLKIRFGEDEDEGSGDDSDDDSDDDDFRVVGPFFTPLCLPALRILELRLTYNTSWPAREFITFQKRSPKITRVCLENCEITSQQLVAVLRRSPWLTTFRLNSCFNCIDDESLRALSGQTRPRPLAPRLQEIDWQEIGDYYDPAVFETAIKSRCSTDGTAPSNSDVVQLKKMTITKHDTFGANPPEWLRNLVEHGLELNII